MERGELGAPDHGETHLWDDGRKKNAMPNKKCSFGRSPVLPIHTMLTRSATFEPDRTGRFGPPFRHSDVRPAAQAVAILWTLSALYGCSTDPLRVGYEDGLASGDIPSWEEFLAKAEPIAGTDSFIFEGDMVVSEDTIFAIYQERYMDEVDKLATRFGIEYAGLDIWSRYEANHLTYCVSDEWGVEKPRALADFREASAQWMSAANLTFEYVPSQDSSCTTYNSGVRINVIPGADGSGAAASFPYQNGRFVRMDYDSSFGTYTWLGTWTHEIGHRLGFRHEHYQACGGAPDGYFAVTPYDQVSTMHYSDAANCGIGHSGQLSALDRQGAAVLYDAPTSTVLKVTPAAWIVASIR